LAAISRNIDAIATTNGGYSGIFEAIHVRFIVPLDKHCQRWHI
jgi:hypothetical protein